MKGRIIEMIIGFIILMTLTAFKAKASDQNQNTLDKPLPVRISGIGNFLFSLNPTVLYISPDEYFDCTILDSRGKTCLVLHDVSKEMNFQAYPLPGGIYYFFYKTSTGAIYKDSLVIQENCIR